MAAEQVLELFDFYWFETIILSKKTPSPLRRNFPQQEDIRSLSDQTMASTSLSFSQNSPPKLPTVLPETEFTEETIKKKAGHGHRTRPGRRGPTRSLSDLEFMELKGFMDLGFVFSEEDKDSPRLVSLIPGLQNMMGRRRRREEAESGVSRPYLSEAWGVLDQRKVTKGTPLMNWRVPSSSLGTANEIHMKYSLRIWAHSVASIFT